jgi:hypothetical protein
MATRPEGRRISPVYIVLGVVAIVAIVGMLLLNSGNNAPLPPITPRPQAGGTTGGAGAVPGATAAPTQEPTEVFEIFEGRDPFRPLITEGGGGGSPAPAGSPGPTSSPSGGGSTPAPAPRQGVQVELLSVASDRQSATVRVGSNVHENVHPGTTIESGVVLDSIQGTCARFHRGSDSFRLCEGEQVLK